MATRDFKIRSGLIVQGDLTLGGNTYSRLIDSDEVVNIINDNVTGLSDSDLKVVADLRNDVDSDSIKIQDLDTTLGTLSTKVDSIEADLDSETARIQLLLLATDSDSLSIAGLKTDADSDAAAIAELLRQADSDAAAIQALRTDFDTDITIIKARLDSDETKIQAIQTDLETAESNITTIQSDISSINTKLDSDDVKLQDAITRIETLEAAPAFTDSDYKVVADLRNDVDSDSIAIQNLGTRIDNLGGSQTINVSAFTFTSPANDSDFTGTDDNGRTLSYVANRIHVYLNGILLTNTADYIATDGSTVSLVNAPDSDDVLTVIKYLGTVQAGFDSEQVVGIINENVVTDPTINTRLDSDSTAIQALGTSINTINTRLDSDETKIQAIQTQLDELDTGDIAALRADADSDSIAIQAIRTSVDSDYSLFNAKIAAFNGLTDSDLTTVSNLRNDVDSDSAKLQTLQGTVDGLGVLSRADSDIVNTITGAQLLDTNQIIGGSVTDVDSFLANDIRAAKYVVVMSSDSDKTYQADEMLVVHDGTNAYVTQYAQVATDDSELATFDATYTAGSVYLQATPTKNNVRFDAQRLHVSVANDSIIILGVDDLRIDSDGPGTFADSISQRQRVSTQISRDPSNGGTNADVMTTRIGTKLDAAFDAATNSAELEYGFLVFYNNGSPVYAFAGAGIPGIFGSHIVPNQMSATGSNTSSQSILRIDYPTQKVNSVQFEGVTYTEGGYDAAGVGNTQFDEIRFYLNNNTTGVTESNSTLALSETIADLTAP